MKKQLFYSSHPHRLLKLLKELKDFCGGEREIQVSRELTKNYEEHFNSILMKLLNYFETKEVVGEITIVIKGIRKKKILNLINFLKKELNELINAGLSLSAASSYLAKKKT